MIEKDKITKVSEIMTGVVIFASIISAVYMLFTM